MLDKILKGVIIVSILSRTSLLLYNSGRNPDGDDYKGKKFTNFSTMVLAYIATHISTNGGNNIDNMIRSIISIAIATVIYTLSDIVWINENKIFTGLGLAVVTALSYAMLRKFSDWKLPEIKSFIPIIFLVAIGLDYASEHLTWGNQAQLISGFVLITDILILAYIAKSNIGGGGNKNLKNFAMITIIFVIVLNVGNFLLEATRTNVQNWQIEGKKWDDIFLPLIILLPLLISFFFIYKDKYENNDVPKRFFYPLAILYLTAISGLMSIGKLKNLEMLDYISVIIVFGFLMYSRFNSDDINSTGMTVLLRFVLFAGILGYTFGSMRSDDEKNPIVLAGGAMLITTVFIFISKKMDSDSKSVSGIESLDFLIVGSLLFAIASATKTKNDEEQQLRSFENPDIRSRNFTIMIFIVGVVFTIIGEMTLEKDQTLWNITSADEKSFVPKFLGYLFGIVTLSMFIASQSVTNFNYYWIMVPLFALIPLGIKINFENNLGQIRDKLPKYLGGSIVVLIVIALLMSDIGSINIDTLIELPLSTFSFGFYESVIPVADYDTQFGDNQGSQALKNLTNSELDSKVIDANRSLLDRITFSTVGYRPSGSLQSGNFSYSISFWCKIVDPSTDMVNQKENFVYMLRNGSPKMDSPGVLYSSSSNQLRVGTLVSNGVVEQYDIDNIPTHKWNHIVIVSEHRNLDTYLNGELVKSYMLNGVKAKMPADQLQVFPDFINGKYSNTEITLVRTFPSALNMTQIKSIYHQNYLDSTPKKKWLWWMTPLWNPIKKSN